eukprot:Clim_evm15s99 gene=Clim_evmTU15s99
MTQPNRAAQPLQSGEPRWQEISKQFIGACQSSLYKGEMLHSDENFDLQAVARARPIMNPTMDFGMRDERDVRIKSPMQAFDKGYVKVDDFDPLHLSYIFDRLIHGAVLWTRNGLQPAYTILSCLYMHDPTLIKDDLLRVPVVALTVSVQRLTMVARMAGLSQHESISFPTPKEFCPPYLEMPTADELAKFKKRVENRLAESEARGDPDVWKWKALSHRATLIAVYTATRTKAFEVSGRAIELGKGGARLLFGVLDDCAKAQQYFRELKDSEEVQEIEARVLKAMPPMDSTNIWLGFDATILRNVAPTLPIARQRKNLFRFNPDIIDAASEAMDLWCQACQFGWPDSGGLHDFLYYYSYNRSPDIISRSVMVLKSMGPSCNKISEAVADLYRWSGLPLLDPSRAELYESFHKNENITQPLRTLMEGLTQHIQVTVKAMAVLPASQLDLLLDLLQKWEKFTEEEVYPREIEIIDEMKTVSAQMVEEYFSDSWMPIYNYSLTWKVYVMILLIRGQFQNDLYSQRELASLILCLRNLNTFQRDMHDRALKRKSVAIELGRLHGGSVGTQSDLDSEIPRELHLKSTLGGSLLSACLRARLDCQVSMLSAYHACLVPLAQLKNIPDPVTDELPNASVRFAHRPIAFLHIKAPKQLSYTETREEFAELKDLSGRALMKKLEEAQELFREAVRTADKIADQLQSGPSVSYFVRRVLVEEHNRISEMCTHNIAVISDCIHAIDGKEEMKVDLKKNDLPYMLSLCNADAMEVVNR